MWRLKPETFDAKLLRQIKNGLFPDEEAVLLKSENLETAISIAN
jgi:hypothetical protein